MIQDIHPLKPLYDLPFLSVWEWAIVLFLLSFVVVKIIIFMWHIWTQKRHKGDHPLPLSFDTSSLEEEIQDLRRYIEIGDFKRLAHEATNKTKDFLSQSHERNMREWTTTEILEWYHDKDDNESYLSDIFQLLDLVKFAKKNVDEVQAHKVIDRILLFIREQ